MKRCKLESKRQPLRRIVISRNKDLQLFIVVIPTMKPIDWFLCRSYDIKLRKTGDFGAKCTKFIPFAWKYLQAILRASCRKAGCAFLLQREFSPLAVRFWEPIASLDRQNRSNFRRKIPARGTYSPPPFIINSRKNLKWKKVFPMSIIIGIDHGYYAIKTAHCSFPAGLTSYGEHEPCGCLSFTIFLCLIADLSDK